jgi:hypothetical protein
MRFREGRWSSLTAREEQKDDETDLKDLAQGLQQALEDTTSYDCPLPQDRIYALLGLLHHNVSSQLSRQLAPDYALDYRVIFRQYAQFLYSHSRQLNLMQRLDVPRVPGQPSWVPDFRRLVAFREEPDNNTAEPATLASVTFSEDGLKMVVVGVHISEVAAVSPRHHLLVGGHGRGPAFPVSLAALTVRANLLHEVLDRKCGIDWMSKLLSEMGGPSDERGSTGSYYHQSTYNLVYQLQRRSDMSRDYFLTFNGCVGICDGVVEGDRVAVLKGSNRPIVLRPRLSTGQHQVDSGNDIDMEFVGSCAISGKFGIAATYSRTFFSKSRSRTKISIV